MTGIEIRIGGVPIEGLQNFPGKLVLDFPGNADLLSKDGEKHLEVSLISEPPPGQLKVVNLYVDSVTKKLVVEYDDVPVP